MTNKTLLVVGAGFGQVPAIKAGKDIGLRVLTVDRNETAPGMSLADGSFVIDIMDKKSVLDLAKKENIDGIITLQSDHGVPTVGYVNSHLGLNGISYETAINCSYKNKCRVILKEKNCAQPDFEFIRNTAEAEKAVEKIGYPCVIKAPDSSGSRGIIKVSSRDDIKRAISEAFKYSNQEEVIIEEFIEGIEFGAQTFSIDGSCEMVLLHNDKLSDPPYMIPIGHSFPFKELSETENEYAVKKIKEAVKAIGINDGPANIDIILDYRRREVKIIEIGARIGATCLPELVEHHTGIKWVEMAVRSAIGETVNLTKKMQQPVAAEIVFSKADGIFRGYKENADPEKFKVIEFEITAEVGDEIGKLKKGTDRIGKILTTGLDVLEAEENCEKYNQSIDLFISDE